MVKVPPGGAGGIAQGGGVFVADFDSAALTDDTIDGNQVDGGSGGSGGLGAGGGAGGNGEGGGLFVTSIGNVVLIGGTIEENQADGAGGGLGGLGGLNGATGQGIGGGVYLSSPAPLRQARRSKAIPPQPAITTSTAHSGPELASRPRS